jgi:hypothetical protein
VQPRQSPIKKIDERHGKWKIINDVPQNRTAREESNELRHAGCGAKDGPVTTDEMRRTIPEVRWYGIQHAFLLGLNQGHKFQLTFWIKETHDVSELGADPTIRVVSEDAA